MREWLEHEDRRALARRWPARAFVDELGPRDAHEQDRGLSRPSGEVLDEIEQRWLGPVDVVDHESQRHLRGHGLE